MIVSDSVFADNTNSINPHVYAPPALSHVTADKFVHVLNTTFIGRTASWDCVIDKVAPKGSVVNKQQRAKKAPGGLSLIFVDLQISIALLRNSNVYLHSLSCICISIL